MSNHTKLVPVQITDREAIALVRERAQRERRSLASAASVTIVEMLGRRNKQNPGQPEFLDNVIVKDQGDLSNEKGGPWYEKK